MFCVLLVNADNPQSKRRQFMIMNIPKKTINVHIMVWSNLNFLSLIYDDPSPTANNTGAVPNAKIAIASPHNQKFPVLIAINCMDKVNPHGKKNVNAPTNGANIGFLVVNAFSDQLFGRCNPVELMLGKRLSKCSHIQSTTTPTNMVNIVVVVKDIAMALPMSPNIPHKRKNHPILHAWNESCVFTWFFVPVPVSPYSANPITILPTIARQVDTDAMIPINNATHNERLSPTEGRYCTTSSL